MMFLVDAVEFLGEYSLYLAFTLAYMLGAWGNVMAFLYACNSIGILIGKYEKFAASGADTAFHKAVFFACFAFAPLTPLIYHVQLIMRHERRGISLADLYFETGSIALLLTVSCLLALVASESINQ